MARRAAGDVAGVAGTGGCPRRALPRRPGRAARRSRSSTRPGGSGHRRAAGSGWLAGTGSCVAVQEGPVGRVLVDQGPVAVGLAHEHGVAVGDAGVLQGPREVDLRLDPLRPAASTDPHVVPGEGDPTRRGPRSGTPSRRAPASRSSSGPAGPRPPSAPPPRARRCRARRAGSRTRRRAGLSSPCAAAVGAGWHRSTVARPADPPPSPGGARAASGAADAAVVGRLGACPLGHVALTRSRLPHVASVRVARRPGSSVMTSVSSTLAFGRTGPVDRVLDLDQLRQALERLVVRRLAAPSRRPAKPAVARLHVAARWASTPSWMASASSSSPMASATRRFIRVDLATSSVHTARTSACPTGSPPTTSVTRAGQHLVADLTPGTPHAQVVVTRLVAPRTGGVVAAAGGPARCGPGEVERRRPPA